MNNLRKCTVLGVPAYFHQWVEKSEIISPSPMIGGHNGGVIKATLGIIEYENGSVAECLPTQIKFTEKPMDYSVTTMVTTPDISIRSIIDEINKSICRAKPLGGGY